MREDVEMLKRQSRKKKSFAHIKSRHGLNEDKRGTWQPPDSRRTKDSTDIKYGHEASPSVADKPEFIGVVR